MTGGREAPAGVVNVADIRFGRSGASQKSDALGMRAMQARVWAKRDARHLLVKAPPASGKSRALMFVAIDKLENQGLAKAIVAVPERSIGASFDTTDLTTHGFFADWSVPERWNLCVEGGGSRGKVDALAAFLGQDEDRVLVCTHATLRFAYERLGPEAFDGCLVAVDEFHHAAADEDNRLGELVRGLLDRDHTHLVAMTGSYFRGDQIAVMRPEDERRFETVTYTYYEQLDGYTHLKTLGLGYHFYRGRYLDAIGEVLDPSKKTILHIPNVNAAEAVMDKYDEVNWIIDVLGRYEDTDPETGFLRVRQDDGTLLRVADLVDDEPKTRDKVVASLRAHAKEKDAVDVIIALGMAKEGFDWIWCEHALTVGYKSSLTEVVQIIGRATRDAPGKTHAQFTNLVAEPLAEQGAVVTGVNDMLKAITASLLMEQVMAPRFRFHPRPPDIDLAEGGEGGDRYREDEETGEVHIYARDIAEPSTDRTRAIIQDDLTDLLANVCQDPRIVARALDDEATTPEVVSQVLVPKVIEERYPDLAPEELEEVRQHLLAGMAVVSEANRLQRQDEDDLAGSERPSATQPDNRDDADPAQVGASRFLDMVRRFVNVADLSVDLIGQINPFQQAYEVLSKRMDAPTLAKIHGAIASQRVQMTEEEALALWPRIQRFRQQHGRPPSAAAPDELEKRLGAALEHLRAAKRRRQNEQVIEAHS